MALYVFTEEMRLEFRHKHRRTVWKTRATKRNKAANRVRDLPHPEIDRQMDRAIEKER